jgi:hypothetical protein
MSIITVGSEYFQPCGKPTNRLIQLYPYSVTEAPAKPCGSILQDQTLGSPYRVYQCLDCEKDLAYLHAKYPEPSKRWPDDNAEDPAGLLEGTGPAER